MDRRIFLRAIAVLGAAGFAFPGRPWAEPAQDAEKFIQGLAGQAISTIADRQLSDSERAIRFRKLFVSHFDIQEIGRFVLSRYWRQATPEQQQEFLTLFEDLSVLTWSKRFKEYNGETLEPTGAGKDGERGWLVESRIVRNQGPPIPIQWRLRQGDDMAFRIVDIIVDGVSMAITHRSDYAAAMQANGGKVDSLLDTMRSKLITLRAEG